MVMVFIIAIIPALITAMFFDPESKIKLASPWTYILWILWGLGIYLSLTYSPLLF